MAKGKKTGGRGRGTKNKLTVERQTEQAAIVAEAKAAGLTPLEVMLENMRFAHRQADELIARVAEASNLNVDDLKGALGMRKLAEDCARDAAPYVHPRLQAIQHMGEGGGPIEITRIEWVAVDPPDTVSESIPPAPARKALPRG
jgi:hypothetical protein